MDNPSNPELVPAKVEKPPIIDINLESFFRKQKELTDKERINFNGALAVWNENGDFETMRRAGVDGNKNSRDRMGKHALLSEAFLKRDTTVPEQQIFSVNFLGVQLAEDAVGAGDCLPANVRAIRIKRKGENWFSEIAIRAINPTVNPPKGRIGYYFESDFKNGVYTYAAIHTGDQILIERTAGSDDPKLKKVIEEEHKALYQSNDVAPRSPDESRTGMSKYAHENVGYVPGAGYAASSGDRATRSKPDDPGDQKATVAKTESKESGAFNPKLNRAILSKLGPYMPTIEEAAVKYNVPKNLIMAIIWQESGGNLRARSFAKAVGLMQIIPETARGLGLRVDETVDERLDPHKNIMAGTRYFSEQLSRYGGNIIYALAAYNGGPGNADRFKRQVENNKPVTLHPETRGYIASIPKIYKSLENGESKAA